MEEAQLPTPSMLSVIVALGIAEIEAEMPGFIDRLINRLGADISPEVVAIRGENAVPAVLTAQRQARLWLRMIRPLVTERPRKGRKR